MGGPPPSFIPMQQQQHPSPAPTPTPFMIPANGQPSFMAPQGGAPPAASPIPGFGGFPPPTGPSSVGTYNYQAAQHGAPVPDASKDVKEKGDLGVKHGRRAISTDPSGKNKRGPTTNEEREDDRPATDPEKPHYKPYTIEDYRKMKEETSKMVLRRGLGPVDNDEVRAEREKRQKMLEYAANANKINKVLDADSDEEQQPKPIVQPVPQDVLERQQRREKALQFAKNVPKPKTKPKEEVSPAPGQPRGGESLDELAKGDHCDARRDKEKALLDLESKHKRDQLMIENIKKQLKLA